MNEALRLDDALRESHPYPMHVRLAADELVWLFEARERDKVAFKQLQAQRDALLEALRYWLPDETMIPAGHEAKWNEAVAAIAAVEGEKT